MGVFSHSDQMIHQNNEPARVAGFSVALEPAYITSWNSSKLGAPPGLALDGSTAPYPEKKVEDFDPQSHGMHWEHSPSKVRPSIEAAVGNVLKEAATYNPQSRRFPKAVAVNQCSQDIRKDAFSDGPRKQRRHQKRRCFLLIATQLRQLEEEDPRKLLVVRKINRLGFKSAEILQEHFGCYGPVSKVLLSNNHQKQEGAPFPVRLRPSGIGYVLFESVEGAARALAEGAVQHVAGVEIAVRAFEKRQNAEAAEAVSNTSDVEDSGDINSGNSSPASKTTDDKSASFEF